MSEPCLFCDFRDGRKQTKKIYEDAHCLAFDDIQPQAPTHVLIIPRQHLANVNDATTENAAVLGQLFVAAAKIAKSRGLSERGYRLVVNTERDACQSVFHLHVHLLGGRALTWPPG